MLAKPFGTVGAFIAGFAIAWTESAHAEISITTATHIAGRAGHRRKSKTTPRAQRGDQDRSKQNRESREHFDRRVSVDWTGVSVHLYRKDHVRTGYEGRGDTELRPPRTGGSPRAGRTCRPDRTARAQRELEGRFLSSRFAGCPPDRSRIANQMSPSLAVLNSRKLLSGTTQRCCGPSQRVQCLLFTLRMLVVPPSGRIRSNCLR
ncbi:hypothetical protein ACVW0I_001931 [Bradyrhizobium sp. LM6.11]